MPGPSTIDLTVSSSLCDIGVIIVYIEPEKQRLNGLLFYFPQTISSSEQAVLCVYVLWPDDASS